ncbi:MAG: Holliday junction resolvase RuvX [Bacteroidota bacterium]|nr:Holliday junction resolvase RuvX [Bacteroidota bacterium]MDP4211952.1 Holliday junction resolvase RuvX [Bacteroidota bacterium]MDP4249243.1 Holliday junction resolvase RuvX [Bacteroidota bacterium]
MPRILAIDYGLKRTGIAVTDPLKIIATALTSIDSARIFTFLTDYLGRETVELILIGDPKNLDDSPTDATPHVHRVIGILNRKFPEIPVLPVDERHTSVMASRAMLEMGLKKSKRREKGTIDQVVATMMLQEYLLNRRS